MTIILGYLLGTHLSSTELNNYHPLVEFSQSVLIYQNSYEKTSVAIFKKFEYGCFTLRLGVTSGYSREMIYKNKRYKIDSVISDNLGAFVVPSYEKGNFVVSIIGDSINAGVVFKLK